MPSVPLLSVVILSGMKVNIVVLNLITRIVVMLSVVALNVTMPDFIMLSGMS
jgi:hypothetical protein